MRQVVRRRELSRVLKGDDPRDSDDFEGSPEYLLLEVEKAAAIIVQTLGCILNTLDKTITTDKKELKDFFDIRDVREVILGIDKVLVESINAKRDQSAIKVAPIKREGMIFNECSESEKSEVKNNDDLFEMPQDYFRLQSDVCSFDLKPPARHHFVFQSMNSYTFVALRELIPVVDRVYVECFDTVRQLIQYGDMVFTKLIPELEESFFQCKIESNNIQQEIELLKKNCGWINWAESQSFVDLLKKHNADFLKHLVDKLILCINQSVERIALLKVMHPLSNSDDLSPILRLLWNISDNMFRPLLNYIERLKAKVGNQNTSDNVAVKRGFSYVCDRIIMEYRSVHPEKTAIGAHITRERRSSDTTAKPSFGIGLSESGHPSSPRREGELFVRRDRVKSTGSVSSQLPRRELIKSTGGVSSPNPRRERVNSTESAHSLFPRREKELLVRRERGKSIDQERAIPIPPKLNLARLSGVLEEPELDQQSDASDSTKSLTRSGKLAGMFSVSPRKRSPGIPDFPPPSDGDQTPQQIVIPPIKTLSPDSLLNQKSESNSADSAKHDGEGSAAVISRNPLEEKEPTAEQNFLGIDSEELDEAAAMLKQMAGSLDL